MAQAVRGGTIPCRSIVQLSIYTYAIDPSFANQECVVNAKGLRFDFQDGLSA